MIQGTTPTSLFKFSVDLALIKEWRICFYQEGRENLIKTNADCIVDENKVIYVKLTQEETLAFDVDKYIKIQVKALTQDNNVISSQIITTHTHEILDKMLFAVENTTPTIIDTSAIEFEFNTEPCGFGLDFEDLYIEKVAGGSDITVDNKLSLTSTNPVQNKVLTEKFNELQEEINKDIGQDGKDGVGIRSIVQTTTSTEDNGKNIITVTLTDGKKSTFTVENGSQGSKGDTGAKGDKGDKGDKGEQGLQGIQGLKGDKGEQGIQGEQGKQGIQGEKGADGKDGVGIQSVTQTTTSTQDSGTNIITVKLTNGNQSTFQVRNGSKGNKGDKGDTGEQGADGYTPVKGKDYFTEADKTEFVELVLEALPNGDEVSY